MIISMFNVNTSCIFIRIPVLHNVKDQFYSDIQYVPVIKLLKVKRKSNKCTYCLTRLDSLCYRQLLYSLLIQILVLYRLLLIDKNDSDDNYNWNEQHVLHNAHSIHPSDAFWIFFPVFDSILCSHWILWMPGWIRNWSSYIIYDTKCTTCRF